MQCSSAWYCNNKHPQICEYATSPSKTTLRPLFAHTIAFFVVVCAENKKPQSAITSANQNLLIPPLHVSPAAFLPEFLRPTFTAFCRILGVPEIGTPIPILPLHDHFFSKNL
eukprot:GEMP01141010.1.p2 GENE.GEMP01141010.1~~GEMP01141010.1.p2  ORF type:complete len:112 (+),score=6.35 GEMP01141010.1:1-336(+)